MFLFSVVQAQNPPPTPAECTPGSIIDSPNLCNPFSGAPPTPGFPDLPPVTTLTGFIAWFIVINAFILGLFTIVAIVFGGFVLITSQGNAESVKKGRAAITWAVVGFTLSILSFVLIASLADFLGATKNLALLDPNAPRPDLTNPISSTDVLSLILLMLQNFLKIIAVIALLFIIISGFRYITATGNEEQATQAKEGLKWSVVGIVVVAFAYVIVRATADLFGL